MQLRELIAELEAMPQGLVVPIGFRDPHSYRADYYAVAFEPSLNVPVSEMQAEAKGAVGAIYQAVKGGSYQMSGGSEVYLAEYGRCGEELSLSLLRYLLCYPIQQTPLWALAQDCDAMRGVRG